MLRQVQAKLYEAVQAQFTDYITNPPDAECFTQDDRWANILAILIRWALNLVLLHPAKTSQNQTFNQVCWSDEFTEEFIFGTDQKV